MGADTWNDAPTMTEGAGWKPDETPATNGGWEPDAAGGDDNFTGEFGAENISKHANGDIDGPSDGGCRICGDPAHFQRDCPEKPPNSGECYNCGQAGHNKADCPNERVEREFTGNCRHCDQVGHRAAECPTKPPTVCKLCKGEGHIASECSANRLLITMDNLSVEDAWATVEAADKEKEVEDIKTAILTYGKAYPDLRFEELEAVFREAGMNTYLIAKQQEVSDTHTIVNLQGTIDQKYAVSIQFGSKPRRAKFAEGWPESPEDNFARLSEAGFVLDRMVPKCTNCDQLGHGSRQCPEDKREKEVKVITCANCNEEGHYARDCTEKRKTGKRECKNCGSDEHLARECPEPRSQADMECRNCGEMGHKAADCTQERKIVCRNCDAKGHVSKDCDKKKDWSRVTCSNCGEKGHGLKRCQQPPKEDENDGDAGDATGGGDWDAPAPAAGGGGDWGTNETAAVDTSGGW